VTNVRPLELDGCRPEPLLSYLKSLGVFRLVTEQADEKARGAWRQGRLVLWTEMDPSDLLEFFLDEYRPSPILAPWNSVSGFWDIRPAASAHRAFEAAEFATHPRMEPVVETIQIARSVIETGLGYDRDQVKDNKGAVIQALRSRLPDEAVRWLDAVAVVTEERNTFPPLLGSGGNDGRLEFTAKFYQRLRQVIPFEKEPDPDAPFDRSRSVGWLTATLGTGEAGGPPTPVIEDTTGQFHPGAVGGPNATASDFEGESLVNPWEYVLGLEGTLLFAASVARRSDRDTRGRAAVPFTTLDSTATGYPSASSVEEFGDRGGQPASRGELWLPLWEKPATRREVAHLFAEGRAQLGRRQAQTGREFAQAAVRLGVDRGITEFRRYSFIRRSGRNHLALPLGRLKVRHRPEVRLLDEVEEWTERLRRLCRGDEVPARYRRTLRGIDRAVFRFCSRGGARALQDVLGALGRAERALAQAPPAFREANYLVPLQGLSSRWVGACDDGSATFRLAAAAASLWGQEGVGATRAYLEPVARGDGGSYRWTDRTHSVTWGTGRLARNLAAVMKRRVQDGLAENLATLPLTGWTRVAPRDVGRFLRAEVEEGRMADLLWGLSCVRWDQDAEFVSDEEGRSAVPSDLPRAYALCKLCFLGEPYRTRADEEVRVRPEPRILRLIKARRIEEACRLAMRRLRADGLVPLGTETPGRGDLPRFQLPASQVRRLGGALLFPVRGVGQLADLVLRRAEPAKSHSIAD
jgi:CRISPR-associated protein Csx17